MLQLLKKNLLPVVAGLLLMQGCDSLTEREEDVTITLDTFNLVGNNGDSNSRISTRATVTGNPGCTASETSLNALLAQTDNFDEIDEYLESLEISSVKYRISNNNTPVPAMAAMHMTDSSTNELVTVASVEIGANESFEDFMPLPFVENGQGTINHYLDNRDATFLYCVEGSPNSSELQMTVELQLDLVVTIDLL